jgi:hypothetical protein
MASKGNKGRNDLDWIHLAHKGKGCGFGGLGISVLASGTQVHAGSNPAKAVGILRAEKSSARLPSEGK